ncbi:MAG: putative hydroxymethylpyrimidine transporter CytX, partial [Kiritimatiellae bacterium]|nr:putative hydroxymethylpyrimidine transporter CytX [Kiritimatiellia bacterium]
MKKEKKGTSALACGLVWFGAAVSIAEIQTGIDIAVHAAGDAFRSAVLAMVAGHLAGGLLIFAVGCIGARLRAGAMDCAKLPFGRFGAGLLAGLNVVQLLGWTAVMVAEGALAASALSSSFGFTTAACAIGALVAVWVFVGLGGVSKVNAAAMGLLFLLTLYLCGRLATAAPPPAEAAAKSDPSFWTVFELSAAMPLSWLPLISDYTRDARSPRLAPAVAAAVYTAVSCWMFGIGLECGLRFPGEGFAGAVLACGATAAGLLVVVFSTVTTTFLDAYSAGESAKSVFRRIPAKPFAVAVATAGTAIAVTVGMDSYLDFLYLVASVFAPMAAVQVVDWFVGGAGRSRPKAAVIANAAAWVAGVAAYLVALAKGCPV